MSALADVDYWSALCRAFYHYPLKHLIAKDLSLDLILQSGVNTSLFKDRQPERCGLLTAGSYHVGKMLWCSLQSGQARNQNNRSRPGGARAKSFDDFHGELAGILLPFQLCPGIPPSLAGHSGAGGRY